MYLQYDTNDEKEVKFRLNLINLDNNIKTETINLGEKLIFNNDIINDGELTIESFEINNKFKIDYKFCIINNECYVSYEYIVPDFRNNYDKTILKIVGNINLKESNIKTDSLFQFINNYGTIVYEINGVSKRQNISPVEIKPSKTSLKDTYYIEILNEIQNAESISLEFNLRNNKYIYKLK